MSDARRRFWRWVWAELRAGWSGAWGFRLGLWWVERRRRRERGAPVVAPGDVGVRVGAAYQSVVRAATGWTVTPASVAAGLVHCPLPVCGETLEVAGVQTWPDGVRAYQIRCPRCGGRWTVAG